MTLKDASMAQGEGIKLTLAEAQRCRELHKFFHPAKKQRRTDPALASYTELVCLRLQVSRAIVSVYDSEDGDKQHVLSDCVATRSDDVEASYSPPHLEQQGYSSRPASDTVCKSVLHLQAADDLAGREIHDPQLNPEFAQVTLICQRPSMRYYYGVPLISRKGARLGVLCILNEGSRKSLTAAERLFMTGIARNIVTHLDLLRDRKDRRRALRMNQCLTQFVERVPLTASRIESSDRKNGSIGKRSVTREPRDNDATSHLEYSMSSVPAEDHATDEADQGRCDSVCDSQYEDSVDGSGSDREPAETESLYRRAARMLATGLVIAKGGVAFLDSGSTKAIDMSNIARERPKRVASGFGNLRGIAGEKSRGAFAECMAEYPRPDKSDATATGHMDPKASPTLFVPRDDLLVLSQKHRHGKLFAAAHDGTTWATGASNSDQSPNTTDSEVEVDFHSPIIFRQIPKARNIIMLPFRDPRSSRHCLCLAWTDEVDAVWSRALEFTFASAFISCLSVELSRQATLTAEQQKGDFLSSISHELRSPLHGILASVEFLNATDMTEFQESLVETVESSGATLLDTLQTVLDHSKINATEKKHEASRRAPLARSGSAQVAGESVDSHPILGAYGRTDLAAIVEEVIEGVAAGQCLVNPSILDFSDTGRTNRGQGQEKGLASQSLDGGSTITSVSGKKSGRVEVLLDIQPRDWSYMTSPGAFRRCVMNIVGNAAKFTTRGYVRIRMEVTSGQPNEPDAMDSVQGVPVSPDVVTFTVQDTGCGISPAFLRDDLYTPFVQQNHLSLGTGLGLSMVRSLVSMLGGDINISSEESVGTEVVLSIPMSRDSGLASAAPTPSTASVSRGDSIERLRRTESSRTIFLFVPEHLHSSLNPYASEAVQTLSNTVTRYIQEWYGLNISKISFLPHLSVPSLIVVDESGFSALLSQIERAKAHRDTANVPRVLLLCENIARQRYLKMYTDSDTLHFVSKPIGPYKFAKAIRLCMERDVSRSTSITQREELLDDAMLKQRNHLSPRLDKQGFTANLDNPQAFHALSSPLTEASATPMPLDSSSEQGGFPFNNTNHISDGRNGLFPDSARPKISSVLSENTHEDSLSAQAGAAAGTAAIDAADKKHQSSHTPSSPLSPRLLLVEDNPLNLKLLQTFAKKRKCEHVTTAINGREAVQAFEAGLAAVPPQPHHIIFLDISMPVMDGFEAATRIRALESERNAKLGPLETPPSTLIIAVTGLASERDQARIFEAGVDLYMCKPVSFKEMGKFLDRWTANAQAELAGNTNGLVPHGSVTAATAMSRENKDDGKELAQMAEQQLKIHTL